MTDDSQRGTVPAPPTARDSRVSFEVDLPTLPPGGYEYGEIIGRGGMGEVVAAHDRRVGRDVALKRMHAGRADTDALRRFLREARIQARLDHPAIVPVHELGTDEQGRVYFTMKRIAGVTLAERIAEDAPTLRLLRALVDACHAVELAHERGVVHRDLKPSNIMLGRYGEVYVLDWGVARIVEATRPTTDRPVGDGVDSYGDATVTGALLGTPGYMAPEQVKGQPATPAADVYAVGAILFEILTREPLHPRGPEALAHTLAHPHAHPSKLRADVAPELDQLCMAALSEDAAKRPTMHELAERLQAYLDGDRDVAQRRALARDELAAARDALARHDRASALRSAGRALALDSESAGAVELVTKLLVEPPAVLPQAIRDRVAAAERTATFDRINKAAFAFLSPLLLIPVLPFLEVVGWSWLIGFYCALLLTGAVAVWTARRRGMTSLPFLLVSLLIVTALWSRLAGPLMLTPALICGMLVALSLHTHLVGHKARLLAWGFVAALLPFGLEAIGIMPNSLAVTDEGLLTTSTVFGGDTLVLPVFVVANTLFVLVVGYYATHLAKVAADARRTLQIQEWHLEQLLSLRAA